MGFHLKLKKTLLPVEPGGGDENVIGIRAFKASDGGGGGQMSHGPPSPLMPPLPYSRKIPNNA